MISVVIPTIPGREELCDQAIRSYRQHTPPELLDLIVIPDSPSCGEGWTRGVAWAEGDYLHLSADDVEAQENWWRGALERPFTCPVLYWPDGRFQGAGGHERMKAQGAQADNVAFPIIRRDIWKLVEPIPPLNHYCDCWITDEAARLGFPALVDWSCRLTHKILSPYDEAAEWESWLVARTGGH